MEFLPGDNQVLIRDMFVKLGSRIARQSDWGCEMKKQDENGIPEYNSHL